MTVRDGAIAFISHQHHIAHRVTEISVIPAGKLGRKLVSFLEDGRVLREGS